MPATLIQPNTTPFGDGPDGQSMWPAVTNVPNEFLEPGQISIHDDRWLTYPWGVNGGHPGACSVDEATTTAPRAEIAKTRPALQMFERGGGTVEEIKARAKAETGVEPPAEPKPHWVKPQAAGAAALKVAAE